MKRTTIYLLSILLVLLAIPVLMYVLNPFGTATLDPRARIFGFVPYRIPSRAMEPTLVPGDYILVDATAYTRVVPEINDVVVFKYPGNPKTKYVKRVIARGGEKVRIDNGRVYVNNKAIDQSYIDASNLTQDYSLSSGEIAVPKGSMFVLGDNRDNSNDSRFWGFVPESYLVGKVSFIWYSAYPDRIGMKVGQKQKHK